MSAEDARAAAPDAPPAPEKHAAATTPAESNLAAPDANTAPEWPEVRHTLRFPIPGDPPIKEIVLREPDLEALERIEEAGLNFDPGKPDKGLTIRQLRPIIAALSGLPDDRLKRMHVKDVLALSELMAPLLDGLST